MPKNEVFHFLQVSTFLFFSLIFDRSRIFNSGVKLNADSEFLVHFELEPHFMGVKWAKSLEKAKKKTFFVNILMTTYLADEIFYMYKVRDPLNIKNIIAFNCLARKNPTM